MVWKRESDVEEAAAAEVCFWDISGVVSCRGQIRFMGRMQRRAQGRHCLQAPEEAVDIGNRL
jgi:hypothetical protein